MPDAAPRTEQGHAVAGNLPTGQLPVAGVNAVDPVDLKVLVIAADGKESDLGSLQQSLREIGVPFDTLIATQSPLTAAKLWDGALHGYYQAVMLTTGNLTYLNPATNQWQSAFSQADWQTLWSYEARFNIRQVTSYTYPAGFPDNYGLNLVGYQDTLTTPLPATLTAAGQQVFADLNPANPVTFKGAWVYLASVANPAVTTPLITTAQGYAIASITTYGDGRQNMAVTAANNTELLHTLLLSYGLVNWATKGLFLGERHVNTGYQIDDLYLDDQIWDPAALSDNSGLIYRNTAADIAALVGWQNTVRSSAVTSGFRLEFAFNSEGTTGIYTPDDLTAAVRANQSRFNFVNHTFSHFNLDAPATASQISSEISRNNTYARIFSNYSRDSLVQPDISGLTNPAFYQAARNTGVRYGISDTSQPGWNNPTPNTGFHPALSPSFLIIPRHPTNLFYNLATPAQWVSEFNYYYGPGGPWAYYDHALTYAEIVNVESDAMLKYLLKWDIDPLMFHIPNFAAYDGVHSLLSDLINATLGKYRAAEKLPIRNLSEHDIGVAMTNRMTYNAAGVTASLVPCTSLTIKATRAATVPVTGASYGTNHESYGGQTISYISLRAGQSVTVPSTVC